MHKFVLAILLLLTAATEAYSCERERLNPIEAKLAADVTFQGTVESIQYLAWNTITHDEPSNCSNTLFCFLSRAARHGKCTELANSGSLRH